MKELKTKLDEKRHQLLIRIDNKIYEDLRRISFEKKTSMNALVMEALKQRYKEGLKGKK